MKPSTTLTVLSHPPLFGRFFSSPGNIANSTKGRAKASENANIVTIGAQNSPWVALISTVPTIGPVQLNDTSTRVRARKNTPPSPLRLSTCASLEFDSLDVSTISKAPKKEAAKTINTRKKMIFGSQCVASQLKMSAVTASPPMSLVTRISTAIGTV